MRRKHSGNASTTRPDASKGDDQRNMIAIIKCLFRTTARISEAATISNGQEMTNNVARPSKPPPTLLMKLARVASPASIQPAIAPSPPLDTISMMLMSGKRWPCRRELKRYERNAGAAILSGRLLARVWPPKAPCCPALELAGDNIDPAHHHRIFM